MSATSTPSSGAEERRIVTEEQGKVFIDLGSDGE
jgi:hypothetical protein